jgi:hypothetical protein
MQSKQQEIKAFLLENLTGKMVSNKTLFERSKAKGYGDRTVYAVMRTLDLQTITYQGVTSYRIPNPIIPQQSTTVNSKLGMDKVNQVMGTKPKLNKYGKPMTEDEIYAEEYGPFNSIDELHTHRKRKEHEDRLGW